MSIFLNSQVPCERAKAFNDSAVLSNFIKFDKDIKQLRLELFINDNLIQFANY
ncbi:MAG: FAA hydrolase family protein, partial [Epsilonproteobacteria bacterium]